MREIISNEPFTKNGKNVLIGIIDDLGLDSVQYVDMDQMSEIFFKLSLRCRFNTGRNAKVFVSSINKAFLPFKPDGEINYFQVTLDTLEKSSQLWYIDNIEDIVTRASEINLRSKSNLNIKDYAFEF